MTQRQKLKQTADQLADELLEQHGPLITGKDLWGTIGFKNARAFRQAKSQGRLDLQVFTLPNRKGNFAFTKHVADWLRNVAGEEEI